MIAFLETNSLFCLAKATDDMAENTKIKYNVTRDFDEDLKVYYENIERA